MHADDMDLVREFAASGSNATFAKLVERHLNLVYSAALRRLGNSHEAEEVAQVVFIILAKKAGSLREETILSGWLYQTAQLTAANAQRANIRRQHREQEAFMQLASEQESNAWPQLSPLLEDAMARLRQKERDAIVLRFFENRTMAEVASALGLGESAAQKRVNRATGKLRKFFASRGIQVSTHGMLNSIGTHAVQVAPAGLASTITTAAVMKGTAAGGSTFTLLKGALKLMAWTKAKTVIVTGVVVLVAAGTTTVAVKEVVAHTTPSRPSATDSSWANDPKYWATDSRVLDKLPSGTFIFRPTQFAAGGGSVWNDSRMSAKNESVSNLLEIAYGFSEQRTIFPNDLPDDHFDVMITSPNYKEQIKNELQKRYGLSAHTETRDVAVLVLKVQNPNPPNLKRSGSLNLNSSWMGSIRKVTIRNMSPHGFFSGFEELLKTPVIDETRLTGNYDLTFQWHPVPGESDDDAFKSALLAQLGLQLFPEQRSIPMLVVDKAQ
jgi:uncharacterized protein (TIGR03435 family)